MHEAYLRTISTAQYFIYIENQYFISSIAQGGIENRVAEEILKRILYAISNSQIFRVIFVLPLIPDGVYEENAGIRYVMHWYFCLSILLKVFIRQYETICRGGNSLLEQVQKQVKKTNMRVEDYVSFHGLRNWGELDMQPVTEQIYVHSKVGFDMSRHC